MRDAGSESVSRLVGTPPPEQDVKIRERIMEYVLREADPQQHKSIKKMYALWKTWNTKHFERRMVVPLIFLNEPSEPKRLGDCGSVSGFGCSSQIRIRPSLLDGTHPCMKRGSGDPDGRFRFVVDVLLHEMIHQWQQEVSGQLDKSYHGHGPAFSAKANEIGGKLGLPPVRRTCKARDGKEPSPSQWPHNVRPEEHYLGVYVPASVDKPKSVTVPTDLERAIPVLRKHFDVEELCKGLRGGLA